jgi:hypothetical protein
MTIALALLLLQTPPEFTISSPRPAPGCKGELVVGNSIFLIAGDRALHQANLACFRSDNRGATWQKLGAVFIDPIEGADLGDGNMVRRSNGDLLAVYRRNHFRGEFDTSPEYGVHVSVSSDGGRTWRLHSIVAQHRIERVGVSTGYWAPFLFLTRSGRLQCYYDDEYTPFERGFRGHQWVEMKTFDAKSNGWTNETTVSRAPNTTDLSRDGMATVVETKPGKLLCVLESVSTAAPVVGNIRSVSSADDGRTWSWQDGRRPVVYQAGRPFHSFCPWLVAGPKGNLFCLFATDEDNGDPHPAGTPANRLRLDIKAMVSRDEGESWSKPWLVYAGAHHNYLPSGARLDSGDLILSWLDFDRGALFSEAKLASAK